MSIYTLGQFITMRREELGVTQDELCEGLCSTVTLSRLENGSQYPRAGTLRAILQRLGYSDALMLAGVSREEFEIAKLEVKIRQLHNLREIDGARELFVRLESYREYFSVADKQFYESSYIDYYPDEFTPQEALDRLEAALRLTHPHYSVNNLPKYISFEEAELLNQIAVTLPDVGRTEETIKILYYMRDFYESGVADPHERLRGLPTVMYNLSKYLGLSGRYDECIDVCKKGIKIMTENGRTLRLSHTFYNLAWALVRRKKPGDAELAKDAAKKAYVLAITFNERESFRNRVKGFIETNFGEDFPLIF